MKFLIWSCYLFGEENSWKFIGSVSSKCKDWSNKNFNFCIPLFRRSIHNFTIYFKIRRLNGLFRVFCLAVLLKFHKLVNPDASKSKNRNGNNLSFYKQFSSKIVLVLQKSAGNFKINFFLKIIMCLCKQNS